MQEVKVSSKGQIVIPKEFRKDLRIKAGEKVAIEEVDGVLFLIPIPKDPVNAMRGLSKGIFRKSAADLIREIREEWQ